MKVCIIGIQNIKHMTLISMYTNFFKQNGIEYDLMYIDKYGIEEKNEANEVFKFNASNKLYNTSIGKALKGIAFKHYAIQIINEKQYDFLVIWREQTASMFADYLCKHYKNRFCVNIRDLWNLHNVFITKGIEKVVKTSAFNTISSRGFLGKIPKAEYILVNSVNHDLLDATTGNKKRIPNKMPIVISYIGTVRFYDYSYELIEAFRDDKRFKLKFIGQGSDCIKQYVEKNNITNVECLGSFLPKDTLKLLEDTDIINSAFGAKNDAEKALMPIRYYYSIYQGCPVLTTEGTWVDAEAKKAGIGISVPYSFDNNLQICNDIYKQYMEIMSTNMEDTLVAYKNEILEENQQFLNKLKSIILSD